MSVARLDSGRPRRRHRGRRCSQASKRASQSEIRFARYTCTSTLRVARRLEEGGNHWLGAPGCSTVLEICIDWGKHPPQPTPNSRCREYGFPEITSFRGREVPGVVQRAPPRRSMPAGPIFAPFRKFHVFERINRPRQAEHDFPFGGSIWSIEDSLPHPMSMLHASAGRPEGSSRGPL